MMMIDKTTLRIGYFQFFVRTDHIMRLSFLFEQLVSLPDIGLWGGGGMAPLCIRHCFWATRFFSLSS